MKATMIVNRDTTDKEVRFNEHLTENTHSMRENTAEGYLLIKK